jgi:hypothetical protein
MHFHLSAIVGLTLSSLIIAFLVESDKARKIPYTKAEKIGIAVFSFWTFGIILDVLFAGGYTFTIVRGWNMIIG